MTQPDRPTRASLRLTEEAADEIRQRAWWGSGRLKRRVTQSGVVLAALAVAARHEDEFIAALAATPEQ